MIAKCPKCAFIRITRQRVTCPHCRSRLSRPTLDELEDIEHEEFGADVEVARLTGADAPDGVPLSFMVELTVNCMQCGVRMRFIGLPCGLDLNGATVSPDGVQARLAIAPEGEVLALVDGPSFTIRGSHA